MDLIQPRLDRVDSGPAQVLDLGFQLERLLLKARHRLPVLGDQNCAKVHEQPSVPTCLQWTSLLQKASNSQC
eukprot:1964672-Rhodomonas_salina.2